MPPQSAAPPPGDPRGDGDRPVLYFDFIDPGSHLVSRVIDRAGVATAIAWRGFELRPPPLPLIDPATAEWTARQAAAQRCAERLRDRDPGPTAAHSDAADPRPGTPPPPLVPWTRKAHELCEFARERGCLHPVRRALFRAHFDERIDIGRIDRLVEVARGASLDRSEARAALDVDRHAKTVLRGRERALRRGVADVPALVWGGRRLEGPAVLCEIERAIEGLVATMRLDEPQE